MTPVSRGCGFSHGVLCSSLVLAVGLSLSVSYGVATETIVLGSREGHWIYGYARPFNLLSIAAFLLASGSAGTLLAVASPAASRWPLVVLWLLFGLGLQALLRSLTPVTFQDIFVSDLANSFYSVTRHYHAATVLMDFDRLRPTWPMHAQSNMPGKLMLVYALKYLSKRPDVLPWLVVVVSNMGGVFMYLFVRDLLADRQVALFSLVLYLLVPAKLYFFPLLNTVTPVVVLLCAWLLLRWLLTGRAAYAALLGVALYGLAFFEPLGLVIGVLFGGLAARAVWRADIPVRAVLLQSGVVVLTFAATYVALRVWWGFDLFRAVRQLGSDALAFNAAQQRPYFTWVRQNLLDFLFGTGVCQAFLFCVAFAGSFSGRERWHTRLAAPMTVLCFSLAGVLLATDLAGVNRGEVIRLWIFLACFFQIPAAFICARLENRFAIVAIVAATLLQDALGTSMIGFVVP